MLPKDVQDRDLLWIFGGGVDEPQASVLEESSAIAWEQTSPTASSNEAGPMEVTSPSGSDDLSRPTGPHELTSESDNEHAEQLPPNHSPTSMSSDIAASPKKVDAEAREEVTSSSSEILPLVPKDEDDAPQQPPEKRRRYRCSRRKGTHGPTVPVQGVFSSKAVLICRKSAEFLIGIGPCRVQRVLHGRADGRTKGMRLPSHASGSHGPLHVCLRFYGVSTTSMRRGCLTSSASTGMTLKVTQSVCKLLLTGPLCQHARHLHLVGLTGMKC